MPKIGKIDRSVFNKVIKGKLGKGNKNIIIGPKHGVDAAAIRVEGSKVMVVAEDPTFGMPSLIPNFGWAIVHICASDVAVLGVPPEYITTCLLFPPSTDSGQLERIWKQVHEECEKLGISVVGGHTGVYPGIDYPLNGGATVFGMGDESELTPPTNARPGDSIIMTKGPAIEAVGVLAIQSEEELKKEYGEKLVDKAKDYIKDMTVVKDSLIISDKVNAMHDATEGGVLNGIYEIAEASEMGCTIYEDKIEIPYEILKVSEYFDIDPLKAISEGTLLATCPSENVDEVIKSLNSENINCWEIGKIHDGKKEFVRENGKKEKLKPIISDPFWHAHFEALKE